jgi:hypothetical protein
MLGQAPSAQSETHVLQQVRCECGRCGAHVVGLLGYTLGGCCNNCGSYDITPLDRAA